MSRKFKGKEIRGKGLKASLVRHELSEKNNQNSYKKIASRKENELLKKKSMSNGKRSNKKDPQNDNSKKRSVPFQKENKLLLVGEGDFSYAVSIVTQGYILANNLIASSFDSQEEMELKYPKVKENIAYLEREGVKVVHNIDATNLIKTMKVKPKAKGGVNRDLTNNENLSCIMFNFPHTGKGIKDMERNVRLHQDLLVQFFSSCKDFFQTYNQSKSDFHYYSLAPENENKIIVTLFEGEPYNSWQIKSLARSSGYQVERSSRFEWDIYPEYHHRRTNSSKDTTKPAEQRNARMYTFEEAKDKSRRKEKEKENVSDSE